MVMACINLHRLGFSCALKSTLAIKVDRSSVSDEHVLVKASVTRHEHLHQPRPDASPLKLWKHEQVRVVNNQVAV